MKVYALDYADDDSGTGCVRKYYSSKVKALKARKEIEEDFEVLRIEKMEVPTSKNQLIKWLNIYADCV